MNTITRRRWLPRFSIRTLIGLVSLVGLFFGTWELTESIGTRSVMEHVQSPHFDPFNARSQGPLLVSVYEYEPQEYPNSALRRHYVWMPGVIVKLPLRFTQYVERVEDRWYSWTGGGRLGGVI